MKRFDSKEQKRQWQKDYLERRKKQGWKFVGWQLPREIAMEVTNLKCKLMHQYKNVSGE
jgi:hypothetical protein